jgi:hypothetical protein
MEGAAVGARVWVGEGEGAVDGARVGSQAWGNAKVSSDFSAASVVGKAEGRGVGLGEEALLLAVDGIQVEKVMTSSQSKSSNVWI